jgi:hypothetical protein
MEMNVSWGKRIGVSHVASVVAETPADGTFGLKTEMATHDVTCLRSLEIMSSSSVVATVVRAVKEALHLFVGFSLLTFIYIFEAGA